MGNRPRSGGGSSSMSLLGETVPDKNRQGASPENGGGRMLSTLPHLLVTIGIVLTGLAAVSLQDTGGRVMAGLLLAVLGVVILRIRRVHTAGGMAPEARYHAASGVLVVRGDGPGVGGHGPGSHRTGWGSFLPGSYYRGYPLRRGRLARHSRRGTPLPVCLGPDGSRRTGELRGGYRWAVSPSGDSLARFPEPGHVCPCVLGGAVLRGAPPEADARRRVGTVDPVL